MSSRLLPIDGPLTGQGKNDAWMQTRSPIEVVAICVTVSATGSSNGGQSPSCRLMLTLSQSVIDPRAGATVETRVSSCLGDV
jgi:hypothetical protein